MTDGKWKFASSYVEAYASALSGFNMVFSFAGLPAPPTVSPAAASKAAEATAESIDQALFDSVYGDIPGGVSALDLATEWSCPSPRCAGETLRADEAACWRCGRSRG